MHLSLLSLVFTLIILIWSFQYAIESILYFINTKIKESMHEVQIEINKHEVDFPNFLKDYREQESFLILDIKRKRLRFLTKIISYFEILLFSTLTVILLRSEPGPQLLGVIKILGLSISGWMALKIFGNYQQWSGALFGRATFYSFLIGTFLNISSAIYIGFYIARSLV